MKPRTYRAGTLKEALARVRRDLGGSAVILGTREVRGRRVLGLGGRELVEVVASTPGDAAPAVAAPAIADDPDRLPPPLPGRLGGLHRAVDDLCRAGRIDHLLPDLPAELVPAYARLLERDVPEPLARRIARLVADAVEPDEAHRPEAVDDGLLRAVAGGLPVAPPIDPAPGTRRVVALVGPTGVGKTTTVAKLAAAAKLGRGLRVGLVTVDTHRIAAVEQLRTYAELIDLPLAVADAPGRVARALDALGPVDLALIDTAGRSPRDGARLRELAEALAGARPDEVHLVLSAASGERALRAAVDRFDALRPDRLLLTKLDEAETLGALLGVVAQAGRPIGYLATGQAVPDDLEPADPLRLAALVLGMEVVS